jgi:hypothetical protein
MKQEITANSWCGDAQLDVSEMFFPRIGQRQCPREVLQAGTKMLLYPTYMLYNNLTCAYAW